MRNVVLSLMLAVLCSCATIEHDDHVGNEEELPFLHLVVLFEEGAPPEVSTDPWTMEYTEYVFPEEGCVAEIPPLHRSDALLPSPPSQAALVCKGELQSGYTVGIGRFCYYIVLVKSSVSPEAFAGAIEQASQYCRSGDAEAAVLYENGGRYLLAFRLAK